MTLQAGQTVQASTAPGYVTDNKRTTASAAFTTTEAVLQSVSFTAVAGARYKVTAVQAVQSTVAGDAAQMRLRWAAGGSVTSAGTEFASSLPTCPLASKSEVTPIVDTFAPAVNGTVTVGVTAVRALGTGSLSSFGDSKMVNTILVERV